MASREVAGVVAVPSGYMHNHGHMLLRPIHFIRRCDIAKMTVLLRVGLLAKLALSM